MKMQKAFLIMTCMIIQFSKCDITTYCADKSERYYPHPEDCTKFIECYAGTTYVKDCPSGLFWNQGATTCDYTCGQDYFPPEAPQTSTTTISTQQTTTQPVGTTAQSSASTQPAETTTQPAETKTQPAEITTTPAESTTQPADSTTQPAETTTQLAGSTTQLAGSTTQPAEITTQPTESTTENGTCNYESVNTVNFDIRHICVIEDNITVSSTLECINHCFHQHNCNCINYQITDLLCELLHCSGSTPSQISASDTVSIRL